ncbi:MAG: hypothetical protein Q9190_005240 [Brigantiaea leucoxantha]
MTDVISALALISTSATLTVTLSKFVTSVRSAPAKFRRLVTEILVLQDVVDECHEVLGRVEAPRHVRESLISCFETGQEVEKLARSASKNMNADRRPLIEAVKLVLRDDELTRAAAVFRERVVLLRDMCSEIRLRGQLVETGAAMARLTALSEQSHLNTRRDFDDLQGRVAAMYGGNGSPAMGQGWDHFRRSLESFHDDELIDAHSAVSSQSHDPERSATLPSAAINRKTAAVRPHNQDLQRRRSAIREQFASLEASNYVVDATVLVENPLMTAGQRFKHVSAEIMQFYPGRVKLDTGSEADFVSLNYLLQAGFTMDFLKAIPTAQQAEVEGIGGAKYTPKFEVELKWFRQGEASTNRGRFLVVDGAPFDILLSSAQFATEAARHLVSLPLVRPRKKREVIAQEIQDDKKRIEVSKALEERDFQAELARRRTMGRASSMHTTGGQHIVELGTSVLVDRLSTH